jgi:competence protein CoiA
MLTALNKCQKVITLTRLSSEKITKLKGQQFFCPACQSQLILKAGDIKIPHFAHKSGAGCTVSHEPETFQHLQGKTLLFQHFSSFISDVSLEYYLADLQQRPDVFIQMNNRKFALEYQCSPISSIDFTSRTAGYRNAGIEPLWIMGGSVKGKGIGTVILSGFQQSFIRYSSHAGYWVANFNSQTKKMYFYYNLCPLSTNVFSTNLYSIPLSSIPFPFQLPFRNADYNQEDQFLASKESWIRKKIKYNRGVNDPFLKSLYLNRDHLLDLPGFIGLPTMHMLLYKSHPVEWQYYIWCDVLKEKNKGETVKLEEFNRSLNTRARSGQVRCRLLPLVEESLRIQALEEYLFVLEKRDIIKKVDRHEYLLLSAHTK